MKSWFESISNKKNSQFIIILLEDQSYVDDGAKSGKTFLLDKIRFDFSDVNVQAYLIEDNARENLSSLPECVDLYLRLYLSFGYYTFKPNGRRNTQNVCAKEPAGMEFLHSF